MSKMTFKPLGDRVLIKRDSAETKTKGGILIPAAAQETVNRGTVVAVGPGRYDERGNLVPQHVKSGDSVMFGKYSGTELKIDGDEYILVAESDVLGTF